MLLELILSPFWFLVDSLINLLPSNTLEVAIDSSIFDLLAHGVAVVGINNFSLCIGSIMFWYGVQFVWAIIEWIYKKIPGVD